MSKEKTVKTYITKLFATIKNGEIEIKDERNFVVKPLSMKIDNAGYIYTTESIPLSAIGFMVASTKDDIIEDGFSVEIEILPKKDFTPNQATQYINTIVNPCFTAYLTDMLKTAKNVNERVENAMVKSDDV